MVKLTLSKFTSKRSAFNVFFITCAVLLFMNIGMYVDYHENTHKAIFRNYGIDSKINYFDFKNFNFFSMTATTTPIEPYSCNANCVSDQNSADIIGYHAITILIAMWSIFVLILFIVMICFRFRDDDKNEPKNINNNTCLE